MMEESVFRRFEIILTVLFTALSLLVLIVIALRIRGLRRKKKPRVPVWSNGVGPAFRAGKTILAVSWLLFAPGLLFYVFIAALPSSVVRVYAKTLFCVVFGAWALLEIVLCFSISERLLRGSRPRRFLFFLSVILWLAGAACLFPFIPRSLAYPAGPDCVALDLPVRGTWLAGHAGASATTNGHFRNRYAIDLLKLGPDGRFYKGREESVRDFYSYDEPVLAPADGRVTQIISDLESDLLGFPDKDHSGGNLIIMDIGNGRYVYLAHLKRGGTAVTEGQIVRKGMLLGRVGNSGYSTHPHLHMHVQDQPRSDSDRKKTFPFRFTKMHRKRLIFWRKISAGILLRNDKLRD
jgi:hypothetical protein